MMKVRYENNLSAGPGYGRLIFSGLQALEGPWHYSLQRATDQKYATAMPGTPWVEHINFIESVGDLAENGDLILFLAPATVDSLSRMDSYKVILKGSDGNEYAAPLRITDIIYSTEEELLTPEAQKTPLVKAPETNQLQGEGTRDTSKLSKPSAEKPESEHKDESVLNFKSDSHKPQSEEKLSNTNLRQYTPVKKTENEIEKPEKTRKKSLLWLALIVIFAAGMGYLLFQQQNSGKETSSRQSESKESAAKNESSEGPGTQESVNKFLRANDKTAEKALELAKTLKVKTAEEKDAVFRLYYFASNAGLPEGLLAYAACLDPSLPDWGTVKKDGDTALQLYTRAAGQDNPAAISARDNLLKWLKEKADNGQREAKKGLEIK